MQNEVWRTAVGFSEYMISSYGKVKNRKTGRYLKPQISNSGYLRVALYSFKRGYQNSIHRLVAKAFIPNVENKETVNHKNGIKTDNRLENLEWATAKENHKHAHKIGLKKSPKGEKSPMARLTADEVLFIKTFGADFKKTRLAEVFGVSRTNIYLILKGNRWSHV